MNSATADAGTFHTYTHWKVACAQGLAASVSENMYSGMLTQSAEIDGLWLIGSEAFVLSTESDHSKQGMQANLTAQVGKLVADWEQLSVLGPLQEQLQAATAVHLVAVTAGGQAPPSGSCPTHLTIAPGHSVPVHIYSVSMHELLASIPCARHFAPSKAD